jgi:hypothetical protein
MKPVITYILLIFVSISAYAQVTPEDLDKKISPLSERLNKLQTENTRLNTDIKNIHTALTEANSRIDSLNNLAQHNSNAIKETGSALDSRITATQTNAKEKFSDIDDVLSKKTLYAISAMLCCVLISGLVYWLLSKRQQSDKSDFIDQLNKAKSSIEENLVKEFGKQTDLMDAQLQMLEKQKAIAPASSTAEPDHSFALKVAGEINLIERNISLMDPKVRGLKQLHASVGKLRDNLNANGYEMPVLLGKKFNEGMKVIIVNSIPDENLEKDAEIISKILIPQVNYNDKMIQAAQIEVSVGV